jgi:hypothetical protein
MAQGLDRCDQFFDDKKLWQCRHSRSKSLYLDSTFIDAPLDLYSRALKGNNDVIRIYFDCESDQEYAWFANTICDLPSSVTSIEVLDRRRLPPIQRDTPLFVHDDADSQYLETFLNNDQSLACTRDTYVFMQLTNCWTIAVSFASTFLPITDAQYHRPLHESSAIVSFHCAIGIVTTGNFHTAVEPASNNSTYQVSSKSLSAVSRKPRPRQSRSSTWHHGAQARLNLTHSGVPHLILNRPKVLHLAAAVAAYTHPSFGIVFTREVSPMTWSNVARDIS